MQLIYDDNNINIDICIKVFRYLVLSCVIICSSWSRVHYTDSVDYILLQG